MKHLAPFLFLIAVAAQAAPTRNVEIIRDDWGIAHVYGKTDADAVYGMIYAQCEDDFNRVEHNYLLSLGRLAEADGESEIYRDLRMKLFIDPADLKAKYSQSPAWLQSLMNAWADGINHYLATHPDVKPKVITHFEPWMALSFTEGSIGGDIETINLEELRAFYEKTPSTPIAQLRVDEENGSNGIAIAPKLTTLHHALLLINPHTSHYFRSELQMVSEEGLDAYGAVTWGQIFIYQGFNPHAGWMHTSSGVDNIDEFAETIAKNSYKYGDEERPLRTRTITIPYKTAGGMASKTFTAYFTKHGPVVREADGKWISVALMQDPVHALIQSYSRTKARSYKEYVKIMELHTNSSNNTLFADSAGDIAYFHSNFIPRRNPRFDYTKPVDGSDPATDWHGVLSIDETPNSINPPNGWVYNSNNWPWSAAGPNSPKRSDYPPYVERGYEETARGVHALRVLTEQKDFTLQKLIDTAFDSDLPAFDKLLPPLLKDYDELPASDPVKSQLADPIDVLRKWDHRWAASSVATSVAIFWAEEVGRRVASEARSNHMTPDDYSVEKASAQERLQSLTAAVDRLRSDFGDWKTAWGDINRFQRFHDDIEPHFDDSKPSIPIPFTYSRWGSLASFSAKRYPNTKKWYGTSGNSFVAVVEFGPRVHARAVTAGGESGDPASPHFNDEAGRYASGDLREVYFYREQLKGHTQRQYRPAADYATHSLALANPPIAGGMAMDYIAYDHATGMVWAPVSNTGTIYVVDAKTEDVKKIEGLATKEVEIRGNKRTIGPTAANVGNHVVYIGNRGDQSVCAYDAISFAKGACGTLDATPDGVMYVELTNEVWVTTPRDKSIRILDAKTLKEKAKLTFDGAPEGFTVDAKRKRFYTNLEDKDLTLGIDLSSHKTVSTWKPNCGPEGPHGIHADAARAQVLVVCDAKIEVFDHEGNIASSVETGDGVDDFAYDTATHTAYVGAAKDAKLTIATVDAKGKLTVTAQVPTEKGARNPVVTKSGTVYLAHSGNANLNDLFVVIPAK